MSTTQQFAVTHSDAEWRALLTPEQYAILRGHGTERPGGCGQKLFTAKKKFESGTGWPSFNDPEPGAVETQVDRSHGMIRMECHCSRCGGHLGHVFEDGPKPTGLRYCINGVAMNFTPDE
jgi:peptide-methionine (R)-S-oxide reductase